MSVDVGEKDLLGKAETVAKQTEDDNPLYALQKAIAAMPAVDAEKVEAVIAKLRNGVLDSMGTEDERLASAQRIAAQILDESASKPK